MSKDERDVLELLRAELDYLEKGGYGRRVRTPRKPTSIFQDSLTCLNFGYPYRAHPCDECFLDALVPPERHAEEVPCHHIALDAEGTTVEDIESEDNQQKLEEKVKAWLRSKIMEIEEQRALPVQS
jgi:hypothetical protein